LRWQREEQERRRLVLEAEAQRQREGKMASDIRDFKSANKKLVKEKENLQRTITQREKNER